MAVRLVSVLGSLALVLAFFATGCERTPSSQSSQAIEGVVLREMERVSRHAQKRQSDAFSNIELQTQFGETVSFYDDLLRDRSVIVNFFYTTCAKTCPGTAARLAQMNDALHPWIGEDITMLSISLDPVVDTPEKMREYWEAFGSKPGWLMLTGDEVEINRLRRQMGVYDLDPVIDADKTQHAGILTFGNDHTNRWAALPVFMHRERMLETILHTTREPAWGRLQGSGGVEVSSEARLYEARGIVRAIFPDRDQVSIEHEAIPGLMMGMTMVFTLADPALGAGLTVGDPVAFQLRVREDAHEIVTVRGVEARPAVPAAPRVRSS